MTRAKSVRKGLAAAAGLALAAWSGSAQAACGITGSATASGGTYDPFNPAGFPTATVTLNLTRINDANGNKTDKVNFFLRSNSTAADGTSIIPTQVLVKGQHEGQNLDIFYDFNQPAPIYAPTTVSPSAINRFLKILFTGNDDASDTVQVVFQITLPANLDLNASVNLPFDAVFACSTTGGGGPTQQTGQISNAVVFPITVLSALQATYAGTALDFGEIGTVTTADVGNAPLTYVTPPINYVRVQSSGPYSIQMTSANNYVLTPSGAATADPLQRIGYRVKFLGQTRGTANSTAVSYVCPRAGVGSAAEDQLYVQAQLAEGGAGKAVSPTYLDTLTVTVAPLAASIPTTSPGECAALSGQF